jgi:hypothetical protein
VCAEGVCTHPNNDSCECIDDEDCDDDDVCNGVETCSVDNTCVTSGALDCDDSNACTDDDCNAQSGCVYTNNTDPCPDADSCTTDTCGGGICLREDNGSCSGTPFVVNNFNNSVDFVTNLVTTPGGRPLSVTGFDLVNLEANANAYLAASVSSTLEMGLASLSGLTRIRITIQSAQANTASMVSVGLNDGSFHDLLLSDYAAISQGIYGVIEIPIADFDATVSDVTEMRLVFTPTGGQKVWRIDHIAVD